VAKAKAEFEAAEKERKEKAAKVVQATDKSFNLGDLDADAKKAALDAKREAEKAAQEAEKVLMAKKRELEKAETRVKSSQELALKRASDLKAARESASGKGGATQSVAPGAVKKAVKDAGANDTYVPLTAAEMRKVVAYLCLPGGEPIIISLGQILKSHFSGISTEAKFYKELKALLIPGVKTTKK